MQIRFLLGPAGSGKTHRCLTEIREALQNNSAGQPLILLAPKQATFQLERQLLADASLPGYTRLHILSFERLAEFVFEQLEKPSPELLNEDGRVMVLRALLEQKRGELKLFRSSARMSGFTRQLSQLLRELQQFHLTPARLETLAEQAGDTNRLNAKLRDLALILRTYSDWLNANQLQDADGLLDLATASLKAQSSNSKFQIAGLWLDGFAQMTPQERQLLAMVAQHSRQTTLAFCLDSQPHGKPPWHSAWAPVTETFLRCRDELANLPGAQIEIESLERNPTRTRFESEPMLQHLERHWNRPAAFANDELPAASETDTPHASRPTPLRVIACNTPEAEAEFTAREILRHIQESGGRFRQIAVLLRSLDGYHNALRRVFQRYDIPIFLDRRESVAHHPLAELTRYALRLVAYGWEHDDWFGALKTGLVSNDETAIDLLENEALARGWRGKNFWTEPIANTGGSDTALERLRQKLIPPFTQFAAFLASADHRLSGSQLAQAIRDLWADLKVDRKLDEWRTLAGELDPSLNPALHETVWDQMNAWLKNIDLAFARELLFLNDWLPIVEAGLGNLTVGVVPPALDQVLVGTIDRSRNPDLHTVFVLGMNEGVFPAPPATPPLLNRSDREALAAHDAPLGPDFLNQLGLERYYGYIACTRARHQVMLTFAQRDQAGRELNPSAFINHLQTLFPNLPVEAFSKIDDWQSAGHWSELVVPLLKDKALPAQSLLRANSEIEATLRQWQQVKRSSAEETLSTDLVEKLYGWELRTSVSGLEEFAACPFRFFISRGLRAEERVEFEIDSREKGSFQHEVLKEFHLRLKAQGKRWRDLAPAEARLLIRQIGGEMLPEFKEGLFVVAQARRFAGQMLIEGLERLIETLITWTKHYCFDPAAVEISFGLGEGQLPPWRIDLDDKHALLLRGRIDRVDLCRIEETGETLAVVVDYKSSARELDKVMLLHGLELQLLAYLGALRQFKGLGEELDAARLIPAGAFYVALKGRGGSASTREIEREARDKAKRAGCQHRGRFDGGHLKYFDQSGALKGEQFQFSIKKDGGFASRGNEALPAEEFSALVAHVEEFLRQHGRDIYAGKVGIAPFRWKKETACDFCDYRPICRFDPWTQLYRVLRAPKEAS